MPFQNLNENFLKLTRINLGLNNTKNLEDLKAVLSLALQLSLTMHKTMDYFYIEGSSAGVKQKQQKILFNLLFYFKFVATKKTYTEKNKD